jgi:hypothetical protein
LNNHLLSGEEFKAEAELLMAKTSNSVNIFSGFIKCSAVHWLKDNLDSSVEVNIIGRLSASDLIKGASDLEIYNICKQLGWNVGILNNLHSKVFIFDNEHLMLGSANLTMRGLSLEGYGNIELGTKLAPSEDDLKRIQSMQEDVIWIDDELYTSMQSELNSFDKIEDQHDSFKWSNNLLDKLQPLDPNIWVQDLFHTHPLDFVVSIEDWMSELEDSFGEEDQGFDSADFAHKKPLQNQDLINDISLLRVSPVEIMSMLPGNIVGFRRAVVHIEPEFMDEYLKHETLLSNLFRQTKIFKWLINLLKENSDHTHKNFGWVTSHLHNALMDDPAPSRGGIKFFVDNLFRWVEAFGGDEIQTTHYERTTGLELITSNKNTFIKNIQTYEKASNNPRAEHNIKRVNWIDNGKTYYQIKLDAHEDNQYLHRVGENNVNLDGHLAYDLKKDFIRKSSDSWIGGPYDGNDSFGLLAKMPDYSLLHDGVTGIPQRLYSFFELEYGSKEDIDCEIEMGPIYSSNNGQNKVDYPVFKAKFIAEKNINTNRYILKFGSDIKHLIREKISNWELIQTGKKIEDLKPLDELIFFKKTKKKYRFYIDIYYEDKYEETV